jgi:hypothetical protein
MTPVPYENSFIYPDLPTVQEEGLPAFDVEVWLGLYGPAGMPADVITALNSAVTKALQVDALKTAFAKIGIEPRGHEYGAGRLTPRLCGIALLTAYKSHLFVAAFNLATHKKQLRGQKH